MKKRTIIMLIVVSLLTVAGILIWRHVSQPIRIGVILPIDTSLGNEENLFIRYYHDHRPKIGWRPVQFLIENPASQEDEFRDAYQRLDAQSVSAVIGGVLSKDGVWLAEEAGSSGIPTFGLTPSSAMLSGKKDGFFRLCATNASQAKAVGLYYQNIGVQRLVLVTSVENIAYVEPYVNAIARAFQGELIRIPFVPNQDTYSRIFNANPDGIFTILAAKDVIQVIKTVRDRDPNIRLGSSSWGSVEILSLYSGPLLDGVLFFSLGAELSGDTYKAEITDFEQKYKMKATNGSHYAVSVLHLLYDALNTVGDSRVAIKAYFETPRVYDTIYGKIAMDEYGDATNKRITILEIVNGAMNKKDIIELE